MSAEELRLITAGNIIKLRQKAGMTQAELGAKLNYSDKSVSKWERGEAIPDAYTLTVMAELFHVTVDALLTMQDTAPVEAEAAEERFSASLLITLVIVSVWTAALTAFVVLWMFDIVFWKIFVIALPVSLLVLLVMECLLFKKRNPQYFIAAFVCSVFLLLFFILPLDKPWKLLPIAIPAVVIVFLSCNLRRKSVNSSKDSTKNELYNS